MRIFIVVVVISILIGASSMSYAQSNYLPIGATNSAVPNDLQGHVEVNYSRLKRMIEERQITSATIALSGHWMSLETAQGEKFSTRVSADLKLADQLVASGAEVNFVRYFPYSSTTGDLDAQYGAYIVYSVMPWVIGGGLVFAYFWFSSRRAKKQREWVEAQNEAFFKRLEDIVVAKREDRG